MALIAPGRRVMWIGLNPSTADEQRLDPTLRRIRAFSAAWGYSCFTMTNLFGFRATDPNDMKRASDPVGPENDATLQRVARESDLIIAAWGVHGAWLDRANRVMGGILAGHELHCLDLTRDQHPRHPLYCPGGTVPQRYKTAL